MTKKCWGCEKEVAEYWENLDPTAEDDVMCDDCHYELLGMMAENIAREEWKWHETGNKTGGDDAQSGGAVIFNQLKGGDEK
jgi:hypothetical protein